MAERIVEVISIASAAGWSIGSHGEGYEPLAVWAVVMVFDHSYPALGASKKIVGLLSSELDDLGSVEFEGRMYWHASEIG